MVQKCLGVIILINIFTIVLTKYEAVNLNSQNAISPKTYAVWRNATVPFYVNPEHFDHEQTLNILNALAMFAFKTCIKFKPVMAKPASTDEVLTFVNPEGSKRCKLGTGGHSIFTPHLVPLGYECLKSPHIDMIIMKALGFPFEHNRPDRDSEITVLHENIETGSIDLFTKEETLPQELRYLPYDIHSVTHFGNRDYSKNGHRTIIFKDENIQQTRIDLSPTDIKKIELVYGPECRARDRQEKIELCQSYPGVARRKREVGNDLHNAEEDSNNNQAFVRRKRDAEDVMVTKSLRVNPDITPPPEILSNNITPILKELGIDNEVQEVVEQIHKVSSLALNNAREKYCNKNTKAVARTGDIKVTKNTSDILGIIYVITDYAQGIVNDAVVNLTKFCEESGTKEGYQRYGCMHSRDPRCRESYRSTKSGAVQYSTQHRPIIQFATQVHHSHKAVQYGRARNDTEESGDTKQAARRKREAEATTATDKPPERNVVANKSETSEKAADDNVKSKDVQDTKTSDKTAEREREEKKAVEVDKKKEREEKKNVVAEAKKTPAAEVKEVETKVENARNVEEKSILRMGTMSPGLRDGKRKPKYDPIDRRSFHGKHNRGKHAAYQSEDEDSESIRETPTIIKPKRGNRKEKYSIKESKYIRNDKIRGPVKKNIAKHLAPADDDDVSEDSDGIEESYTLVKKKKHPEHLETLALDGSDVGPSQDSDEGTEKYAVSKKKSLIEPVKAQDDGSMDDNEDVASQSREKVKNTYNKAKLGKLEVPVDDNASDEAPKETHVHKNKNKYREKQGKEGLPERDESSIKKHKKQKRVKESGLPKTVTLSKKNQDFYAERMWPDGKLYFMIQEDTTYDLSDMRRRLAAVNKILKVKTCVKMVEIKPEDTERFEDYILIDKSPDYVTGRVGGKQRFGAIELFRGGQHRQHAAMMVMAMLGFYFEVARHDRDKYIRVHMRHVRPDKLHHFEMIRSDATLPLPYDYASATHPAWQFWRQMGRTGISTVATLKGMDPDGRTMKSLGQNAKLLSDTDIIKINSVYGVDCFRHQRAKTEATRGKNKNITVP